MDGINRIFKFLADVSNFPGSRLGNPGSSAQHETATPNGRPSGGPGAVNGGTGLSANPPARGSAPTITPRRDDDDAYLRIRRELIAELKPAGIIATTAVDMLAHDYVEHRGVMAMIASLKRLPMTAAETERCRRLRVARLEIPIFEETLEGLEKGHRFNRPRKTAYRVAREIVGFVEHLREEEESGDLAPPLDDSEREEYRQLRELYAMIHHVMPSLCDHDHVAAIFIGRIKPAGVEVAGLTDILRRVIDEIKSWIRGQEAFELRIRGRQTQWLAAETESSARMEVLQRHRTKIEASIRSKLRDLKG